MNRHGRSIAILLVLLVAAAACGGRLTEEEIRAELSADGFSGTGRTATGPGEGGDFEDAATSPDGNTVGDGAASGPGEGAGNGGAGSTNGGGGGGGGGGDGSTPNDPNAAAPEGGNGGATDVGVTETEIVIGNVSTLSGPVAGLFRGALVGTQAAYAHQNSLGGLFGRTFQIVSGDDNFDAGQNRSRHKELKDKVFAFSGSFSLFDGASVPEISSAGVLDVGRALGKERHDMETHMTPAPFDIGWASTGCNYLKQRFGAEKVKKMAIFWGNADAARSNAAWQQNACESVGFEFIYGRELQATETNFTTDAIRMQSEGVEGYLIIFDVSGIARFMKSMQQQGFVPPIRYPSPAAYDSDLFKLAGTEPVEGLIIGQNLKLYLGEDAANSPEIALFLEWMGKVDPRQKIDIFSFFGWQSGRLMIEGMKRAGPQVTREGVLAQLREIHEWDNFGTTQPLDIGAKKPGVCEMFMEVRGGKFVRVAPADGFDCSGKFVPYEGSGRPQV